LVFRVENQHCAEWGVATEDDWNQADPPVYVRQPGDRRWEPFLDRVSTARAEMALSEVLIGRGRLGDMCQLTAELFTGVESAYDQPSPCRRSRAPRRPGRFSAAGSATLLPALRASDTDRSDRPLVC
jgi:hypothetical protein